MNPYHFLSLLEKKARAVDHAVVMQSFSLDPIFYKLKSDLATIVDNPNREWIRVLRMIVDEESCLLGHPQLAKVVVQQHPLNGYDVLLRGNPLLVYFLSS